MAQPDFSLGSSSTFVPEVLPAILSRDAILIESFDATDISIGRSGHEKRIGGWSSPLAEIDIGPGVRTLYTLRLMRTFWRRVFGPRDAFLFHHFLYHTTAVVANLKDRRPGAVTMLDQQFGIGDGVETDFQLVDDHDGAPEDVAKLKTDVFTPLIAIDGVLQNPAVSPPDYTLDTDPATGTGIVSFTTPPAGGEVLTWGGQYFIAVRFKEKMLDISFQNYDRGIATVVMKQVRDFV